MFDNEEKIMTIVYIICFVSVSLGAIFSVKWDMERARKDITHDVYAVITEMNGDNQRLSPDKFRTPQTCNKILFKVADKENTYFTFQSCNNPCRRGDEFVANDEWMYNHNVGDTVLFTALKKSRFFKIKE